MLTKRYSPVMSRILSGLLPPHSLYLQLMMYSGLSSTSRQREYTPAPSPMVSMATNMKGCLLRLAAMRPATSMWSAVPPLLWQSNSETHAPMRST